MSEKKVATRPPGHQTTKRSVAEPGSGLPSFALGNRALARLLASGSVSVSQPGDREEREADRLADAVTVHAPCRDEESATLRSVRPSSTLSGVGPGRPLDSAARVMLELRFGYDLGAVRIDDGPEAAEAAQAAEARAFTVGNDVVFSPGQYSPATPDGRDLLAHEVAHVVQQPAAGSPPVVHRSPFDVQPPAPQPAAPAAAPVGGMPLPVIVEIGATDLISSADLRLARLAKRVLGAQTPSSSISITGFWDANTATTEGGFQRSDALQRAKLAQSALVVLGIPQKSISADAMDRNLLSDPSGSPVGLVRIAFYPAGFQLDPTPPGFTPFAPTPQPPKGLAPRLTPPSLAPGVPPLSKPSDILAPEAKPRKGEVGTR